MPSTRVMGLAYASAPTISKVAPMIDHGFPRARISAGERAYSHQGVALRARLPERAKRMNSNVVNDPSYPPPRDRLSEVRSSGAEDLLLKDPVCGMSVTVRSPPSRPRKWRPSFWRWALFALLNSPHTPGFQRFAHLGCARQRRVFSIRERTGPFECGAASRSARFCRSGCDRLLGTLRESLRR